MIIERFFPTIIGYAINEDIDNKELTNYCLKIKNEVKSGGKNWLSNDTYNTSDGKFDITKDEKFKSLNNWISDRVNDYLNLIKSSDNVKLDGGWLNIYEKGNYQEYHNHPNCAISTIYFLNCDKNSSSVCFKSPYREMLTLKYREDTIDNFDVVCYKPENGKLLIFRSHLEHAVEKQINEGVRITLSHNFKI